MSVDFAKMQEIFLAAVERRHPNDRMAYLDQACASDEEMRRQVDLLLKAHQESGSVLGAEADERDRTGAYATTAQRPGAVIGPYKLLQQIGEGGMGVVWMAEQTQPVQRKVALKLIKYGMDSRQVITRFEAERQALAMMDHVNIARVFDAGATEAGRPYFVMELVHGVPITRYCDDNHLTPRERLELFVPVCQAIQHAHQKGIIHRDIKPSNVMVTLYDGKPVPKVIDFGVAKATEQKLTERTLFTQYGAMVGTLEYMSPEQAEMSALGVDTRSDIYSLGVLLYELLTGSTPLSHKRLREAAHSEILRMIKEEQPPKPSTRLSDSGEALASISAQRHMEPAKLTKLVRGELDWIVMKCLEKDRNRRYETVSAFTADVQRYLNDEPVLACPPSAWYRFRKFARRNKRSLAAAAVLGMALLVAVGAVMGSLGWMARDRSVRQVKLNSEVDLALQEAGRARDLALTQTDNPYQWEATLATALAALKRGAGIAAQDESALDTAVGERLEALKATLDADENDRRFAARIDDIRLEQSEVDVARNRFKAQVAFPAIQEAFKASYRIAVGMTPVEQVVDFIQQRPHAIQEHFLAALYLGEVWAPEGELRAREWLRAVLKSADTDPWRKEARRVLAAREWSALEELVDKAVARQPRVFLLLLAGRLHKEKAPSTLNLLRTIQQAYPDDFWANLDLAAVLCRSAPPQWEESIRYFTAALALRPRNPAVYLHLGHALKGKGDRKGAIAVYRQAVAVSPKYPAAHYNLGVILQETGDVDGAIAAYREAVAIDVGFVWALTNLGVVLMERNDLDGAIAVFRQAMAADPQAVGPHINLGRALLRRGSVDEAIAELREAIRIQPELFEGHANLGNALLSKRLLHEAIASYQKAISIRPNDALIHYSLGNALLSKGLLHEAIASYQKATSIRPNDALIHYSLGLALAKAGSADEGIAAYREALRLKSDFAATRKALAIALNNRAWQLAARRNAPADDAVRAVGLATEAVNLFPEDGLFLNTLGVSHYRAGNWKDARAALEKAMEVGKGGGGFGWFFLAMAHWKLGSKEEARKWYDQAVQWMEKDQPKHEELSRIRAEAALLLGVERKKD